ncbi:MAG: hypothetical protein ACK4Y9_08505 [Hyphomonas sp.]
MPDMLTAILIASIVFLTAAWIVILRRALSNKVGVESVFFGRKPPKDRH